MSPNDRERRLDARVTDGILQVEYVTPGPVVGDLSLTGMYVKDQRPLTRGQPVDLKLRIGDGEAIAIQGMVRRVDPGEGMGIEFIHIDATGRRRIKDYISKINPDKVSPAGDDIFS